MFISILHNASSPSLVLSDNCRMFDYVRMEWFYWNNILFDPLNFSTDTSRPKSSESEIDGQDYNFVSRAQFEEYVSNKRFVEHGEYDKQYYGTSLDAVRTVINSGKICVLNLQPSSLQILHESDLKPYVVFLTPPTLQTYRQQKAKYGEAFKVYSYNMYLIQIEKPLLLSK